MNFINIQLQNIHLNPVLLIFKNWKFFHIQYSGWTNIQVLHHTNKNSLNIYTMTLLSIEYVNQTEVFMMQTLNDGDVRQSVLI
jgi:hypothetical protein